MIPQIRILLFVVTCFAATSAFAQFEDIWHTPSDARSELGGATMRDPLFPGVNTTATFYQGINNEGANQTGGTFYYKVDDGAWQSSSLTFNNDAGDLQFWSTDLSLPASVGAQVQYYFFITLDNRDDTYLYKGTESGEDQGNAKSLLQSDAEAAPYSFAVGPTSSSGSASLSVSGASADYNTLNFYIDEVRDSNFPEIELVLDPGVPSPTDVQIFTNLNNRDRADDDWDGDGIEDGIIPPDGNTITLADTDSYFQAHAMSPDGSGSYSLTLPVEKTGAYRVTARYKNDGDTEWTWLRDQGIRDLAIVVAPTLARDMTMYELHVTNANATGPSFAERGTFEDLHDPNARVNLDWLNNLGLNWIWFQPFHPQGLDGRETDPATGSAYNPGSPYSIRNFWEINPLYSAQYNGGLTDPVSNPDNYAAAMQAFQNFAAASDTAGVNLMLDFPFNHTAPDVVLAEKGVELFAPAGNPDGWQPGDLMRDRVPQFFSTNGGEGPAAYSAPAQSAAGLAVAPDRNDFGKWNDVRDVYFGNYSTLVTGYPDAETSRAIVRNEDDLMFYDSMGPETIDVWRYFGEVLPYWIEQSGHRGFNSTPADGDAETRTTLDRAGIDGLRKDFGQGLPPQAMEYIINRTHSAKWNFVFMSESLDGEQVTYRSSRHFAILNENIVFPFKDATSTQGYRGIFESRRDAYGDSLVLLNNLSHDEEPWADPWQPLIRYAAASANDGVPMIMYGQEIGAAQKAQETLPQGSWDYYEVNFGKNIPHFKKWNSMQPQWTAWDNNDLGVQHLYPVYSAIGKARQFSPALRSNNRWFLNRQADDQPRDEIHAVAKYTDPNAPVAEQDVVFGFVNLNRDATSADTFGIPSGLADQLGIDPGRSYNAKNIAAYTGRFNEFPGRRDDWLWGASGRDGQDIRNDGIFVSLNPVPADEATWDSAPFEAQYLKVYDVTAPIIAPQQPEMPNTFAYAIGDSVSFNWESLPADDGGVVPSYEVNVFVNGSPAGTFITEQSSHTVSAAEGDTVSVEVKAVNPDFTANSGPTSPVSHTVALLDGSADDDGDGQSNADEHAAGTNPLSAASRFEVASNTIAENGDVTLTWDPVSGKTYAIQSKTDLTAPSWTTADTGLTSGSWTDPTPSEDKKFYRIVVE